LEILVATLSLAAVRPVLAQDFNFDRDRMPIVEMRGLWHFHTGDDPRWANPNFDDSGWALLRVDQSWSEQGYNGYGGMAWYRCKILVLQTHKDLAIYIPALADSYQVFANGRLIGQEGGLPPHEKVVEGYIPVHIIPAEMVNGTPISIAIRVWHWPYWAKAFGGGFLIAPRIGEIDLIRDNVNDRNKQQFWDLAAINILVLINLLAGLSGLVLFALRHGEPEYLWFGVFEMLSAAQMGLTDYRYYYSHQFQVFDLLNNCTDSLISLFFLAFVFTLLKGRRNWLYWSAVAAISFQLLAIALRELGWISLTAWAVVGGLLSLPYYASILVLLYSGARRAIPDARLLLGPVALSYTAETVRIVGYAVMSWGRLDMLRYFVWLLPAFQWPFPFFIQDVANLLMQLSIIAILLMRFARTRRDEQRLEAELESARAVQQVLVPSENPAVVGFAIASVYKPAVLVGGDFFQIIPIGDRGVLVVIGDVSGKGLPAAMTVSLLVGTVRTLALFTQSPGEILAAMNQRMFARSGGGFTTCLVLRADLDGVLTIANAGHLAPYCNKAELPLDNGLPLGLVVDTAYTESTFHLDQGEQLTLLTDGIVEARGKNGELFGFERTREVASNPAESIAQAARDFGQEDDITVLTIARLAVGEEPLSRVATPAISPSPA
jgi:hypothetical protein